MERRSMSGFLAAVASYATVLVGLAEAIVVDPGSSFTQPANALLMPFDVTKGSKTLLTVSNFAGTSPGSDQRLPAVTTHWSFWNEDGTFLADAHVCLGLRDTVEIDPRSISSSDRTNALIGPEVNLKGHRGMVTVTAYETDETCRPANNESALVDDAIVGSFSIREAPTIDPASGARQRALTYGSNAIGLGVSEDGTRTALPDVTLERADFQGMGLSIPTMNPSLLARSRLVLLYVDEVHGRNPKEIGPLSFAGVRGQLTFWDADEAATSLPDVTFTGALFASLKAGAPDSLIPGTAVMSSAGLLELQSLKDTLINVPVGLPEKGDFVFAIHGQVEGARSTTVNGVYRVR